MKLRVTAAARNGTGVARADDGRVVFVEGALPGEVVTAELVRTDRRWARARIISVIEASKDRVPISCSHQLEGCGGCDLLHVEPAAQLRMKQSMVVDQLVRAQVKAPDPVLRSLDNDQGRTTIKAAVVNGRAGYRARSSHDVIVPDVCGAVDPAAEQLLVEGRFGQAREVTIRIGNRTGERMVVLNGNANGNGNKVMLPDDVLAVTTAELQSGKRAWIHEEAAGRRWRVSARSFFQNRPAGVDALVDEVTKMVDELADDGVMVDAYAGIGVFAGTVGVGRKVHVIERGKDPTADARVNLNGNDALVLTAAVENWRSSPAAVVVADPAREGLGVRGVRALLRAEPDVFVLVSCDPSSFARDAKLLENGGMTLNRYTVLDLFPGTSHVETVAAFVA
ncbi:MAG: TRAM domain-containing protein [Acidimicrobiia bacterium]|nr:TRAM domain-containing protein [Acidimicrobiia bacterium]MCY4457706.1 TRAM domain-containing protein [Acidimicrobiaceae bacterium]